MCCTLHSILTLSSSILVVIYLSLRREIFWVNFISNMGAKKALSTSNSAHLKGLLTWVIGANRLFGYCVFPNEYYAEA